MRRSHRKSRNGCSQCKTRHIKCNEVKPQCGNCHRLDIACSFAPQTHPPQHPSTVSPLSNPLSTPPIIQPSTQPLCLLDLELYHHFIYHYSASLISDAELRADIFEKVMELALSYRFLMHNFMALSALHLYSRDRSRSELFDRACFLQGVAIQQVQPVIANLQEQDALAALMFSSHTSAFGLAEFMLNPHQDDTDPIDKIVECFQLSRGIKVVVSPYWPYLSRTWLRRLFADTEAHENHIRATLATDYPPYPMVRSLAFGQDDPDRRKCCLETIDDIFRYIGTLERYPDAFPTSAHLIDAWAVRLPAVFKDMLIERRPVTLIILAYWAVLTSVNPRPWHLRGLAEILIARIETILGDEWAEFIRWPKEKILENARAAQDTPAQTPNVDIRLKAVHLSHESSLDNTATEVQPAAPLPRHAASNHVSPYNNSPITQHSPYPPASDQHSPYPSGSSQHSPYPSASNTHSPYPPAANAHSPYSIGGTHSSVYNQGPPT